MYVLVLIVFSCMAFILHCRYIFLKFYFLWFIIIIIIITGFKI